MSIPAEPDATDLTVSEGATAIERDARPRGREDVWDVLRGVGVLGIFSVHAFVFAFPHAHFFTRNLDPAGDWPFMLAMMLSNGKFITMLAMTFGAGVAMIASRASHPRRVLFRRFGVLALFGAAHYLLLFGGDILQYYALCGMAVVVWFAMASDRVLKWLAGGALSVAVLIATFVAGLMLVGWMIPSMELESKLVDPEAHAAEIAAYTGTYGEAVRYRLSEWPWVALALLLIEGPFVIGLMFIGILAWRHGWLARPSQHPQLFRWGVGLGLGIGVPFCVLTGLATSPLMLVAVVYPQRMVGGALVGIAMALLLARYVEAGPGPVGGVLRAVGQRSLTCYLFQSVAGGFIFYSWGLGYFNQLSTIAVAAVIPAVWALTIGLALALQKANVRGPAEWLWRQLAPTSKPG